MARFISPVFQVSTLRRPVAGVRVASATKDWKLPFQDTLVDGSLKRFFRDRRGEISLNKDALLQALATNASVFITDEELHEETRVAEGSLENLPDIEIVHGKDFLALLTWALGLPFVTVQGMLMLSITTCAEAMRGYPNINSVKNWLLV